MDRAVERIIALHHAIKAIHTFEVRSNSPGGGGGIRTRTA